MIVVPGRSAGAEHVPEVQPGEYVIVHAGVAISRLDPVEAQRVFAYLKGIGTDFEEETDEVRR